MQKKFKKFLKLISAADKQRELLLLVLLFLLLFGFANSIFNKISYLQKITKKKKKQT